MIFDITEINDSFLYNHTCIKNDKQNYLKKKINKLVKDNRKLWTDKMKISICNFFFNKTQILYGNHL